MINSAHRIRIKGVNDAIDDAVRTQENLMRYGERPSQQIKDLIDRLESELTAMNSAYAHRNVKVRDDGV